MINKLFYINISRGHCEFKNCNCQQYTKEDKNKRDKINPKCKNVNMENVCIFLKKDLPA